MVLTQLPLRLVFHSALFLGPLSLLSQSWPPRLPAHGWCCLCLLLCWSEGEYFVQRKHRATSTAREGAVPLLQGLLLVTLLLVGFLTTQDFVPTYAHFAVSLSLFLVGVSLRLLAIKTMCGFFLDGVRLREDHTLVTTGLYAFVRHPSEVGTFCILCGFATLSQSSWLVAGLAFCWVPFACWRIGREEQLLLKRFQGEFLHYKARTSRFFPGFF